jgi:tetratricopeptide (TPR) repeat protein
MVSPLFSRVAQRFLRAEILFELGRYDEAVQWYSTIGEISPSGLPYRSVALLRLSEIAAASGDQESAAIYRTAFEELWSDADPEMLAEVSG